MIESSYNSPPYNVSDQDFRGMIESTSGIPWMVDLSTFQFTYVGPQAETILGYPVSYWYKTDFWPQHMHPDDRDYALNFCAEASQKGENYSFEYRMIHRDGHDVHLLDYVNIVFKDNVAVGLQGFMFDISEKRLTENAIKDIAAGVSMKTGQDFYNHLVKHLASIFNADYAFIALIDNDDAQFVHTTAVWKGDQFGANFSYSLENTPCANVLGSAACCHITNAQTQYPLDEFLVNLNVETYIGTTLFDMQNNPIGLIAVLDRKPIIESPQTNEILTIFATRASTEIERIKAEKALKHHQNNLEKLIEDRTAELRMLNQELESFSYSVSHDLRAPLRHIDGFSRIITEDYAESLEPGVLEYLDRICISANKMGELIDSLLQLSRVTQSKMSRKNISITSMAWEILEEKMSHKSDRIVSIDIQENMMATADYQLIYTVLENIINNAWKYSSKKENAVIKIGVTTKKQTLQHSRKVFFISDNGAGFNMEYKDKLFSVFQRLHKHTDFEGTGIGLATVQRIIHRHGGEIWAESVVDKGTTFYFTLK